MAQPDNRRRGLDQPRGTVRRRSGLVSRETVGLYSERIARFFGTARYLVIQTIVVVVWIGMNVWLATRGDAFDEYPFILLNLAFSTQAAYAAPLILLAQNRQAARERVSLEEDRAQNARAVADAEYLAREIAAIRIALRDVATRDFLRNELARIDSGNDRSRDAG
jgi:uncharacterized membrane protein